MARWVLTGERKQGLQWNRVWYAGRKRIETESNQSSNYAVVWLSSFSRSVKIYLTRKGVKRAKQWVEDNEIGLENLRSLKIEKLPKQPKSYKRERNYPIGKEIEKQYPIGKEIEIFHPDNGDKVKAIVIDHILEPPRFRRVWAIKVRLVNEPAVQVEILHSYLNKDGSGTHLLTGFEDWADR